MNDMIAWIAAEAEGPEVGEDAGLRQQVREGVRVRVPAQGLSESSVSGGCSGGKGGRGWLAVPTLRKGREGWGTHGIASARGIGGGG